MRFRVVVGFLVVCLSTDLAGQSIATVAGGGSDDQHPPHVIGLNAPSAVAIDHRGDVYIVDQFNSMIRRFDQATGLVVTVAGNGSRGFSGDGGPASQASLYWPSDIAFDTSDNLYIADSLNNRVRVVDRKGMIRTIAGIDKVGFNGDGPVAAVSLYHPSGIAIESSGAVIVADAGNERIRRISNGIVQTIVTGARLSSAQGDGNVLVPMPRALALDAGGNIYFAEVFANRVRRYDSGTKVITTVAGNGSGEKPSGDNGPATMATLRSPVGLAFGAGSTPMDFS